MKRVFRRQLKETNCPRSSLQQVRTINDCPPPNPDPHIQTPWDHLLHQRIYQSNIQSISGVHYTYTKQSPVVRQSINCIRRPQYSPHICVVGCVYVPITPSPDHRFLFHPSPWGREGCLRKNIVLCIRMSARARPNQPTY